MTLPFEEKVVNDFAFSKDNFENPNYIGYLNEAGVPIDFKISGYLGHNCDSISPLFIENFQMRCYDEFQLAINGKRVVDLEFERIVAQLGREKFTKLVEKYVKSLQNAIYPKTEYERFVHDIEMFFYNCYQADTFFDGFGQPCMYLNEYEYFSQYDIALYQIQENEDEAMKKQRKLLEEFDYIWYKKKLIMDWFKSVVVQYLHYHSIERCGNGITTSDLTPYETFYNYILNDFTIFQIPRMIYDPAAKIYVPYQQNPFLVPDSELRLQEELQAIKKLVPKNERWRYYR